MSINGSVASFLPFTINGLTDASFSNSNLGAATATSLTLTSATPLKLARFDLDKNLVSASVDESEVAVLTSNVFDGTQTMKPGHTTNINNVFETTIVPNPPYDKSSFTTSDISGYTAPLGTITGPVAGEYSISQTASNRSVMKIDSFVPEAGRKYVYTFTMRIIDAPEAYVSVEQGGVQRSNTIIQIGTNDETISDTFTFDPSGSTLVFKIYTGSLDPWTATWSSFSLGYYEASINAPINNLTITNLATEILAFPSTSSNSESWSVYAISTMGNPSTLGGIIFQEATMGVGAYITDGVVGAKSFQFNTLSGNAGKVVCTNGDQVMSTTINAGQLDFITGLTSQAANSVTTGSNRITQEYNATVGDISTLVNRATLDSSIAGLGAGILNLNNEWTGTNTYYSTLTTVVGQTTSINGALSTNLNDLGFTSASFTTAGITGAYTPPLGTITNPSGSTYQITQTAAGRSIMAISGFTPSVGITYIFEFNINCTIGTATISVEQDNILVSPALYPLTTGFNKVVGSFTYNGTPNTVVFKIYTGVASWNAQWDSFVLSTYSIGMNANMNALTVNNRFTQRYNALPTDISTLVNRATMDAANLLPLNNVWNGSNTFNNSLQVAGGNMTCSLGVIAKQTATAGSLVQLAGGGAGNSPYLEFLFGGNSRGYIGNASAVDLDLVAQNGAKLNFYTAGTKRLEIQTGGDVVATTNLKGGSLFVNGGGTYAEGCIYSDANWGMLFRAKIAGAAAAFSFHNSAGTEKLRMIDAGVMSHTAGDDSYMIYGPNATWNSKLVVGATPDRSAAATAQVITTNGNLHLDAGNSNAMYYGYYANARGTPNSHEFYGTVNLFSGTYVFNALAYNTYIYAHSVVLEGSILRRSQCLMNQVYKVDYISWGPGIQMAYAFYKYSQVCPVRISGKYSGYCTFVGMPTMTIRIYSQNSGATRYYAFPTYQNITYAQTTYPIDIILDHTILPETGWFDIYIYNSYGMSTDINNQLWVNVQLLPVNSF